ncbi:two-component system sensor histidine kinase NtrB [Desulfocurvus sp. DL9XJH121]
MDIGLKVRDRSFLFGATLALVLLGLGLSFLTFQSLRRQRETVEEHMFLASQSILRGIEGALARELRDHLPRLLRRRMHGGAPGGHMRPEAPDGIPGEILRNLPGGLLDGRDAKTRIEEMFTELAAEGDVEFIALYARQDALLSGVTQDKDKELPKLPASAWRQLSTAGFWAAMYTGGRREMFVSSIRLRPSLARLCTLDSSLDCPPGAPAFPVLVVGMDPGKHLDNFKKFKRAALLQTGYVLLVALFLWGLAVAYLRRRDQGRALHRLETFHSRLLDTMPDGLVTLDSGGVILAANPAATRLLGGGEELVGTRWDELPLVGGAGWSGAHTGVSDTGWVQYEAGGRSLELLSAPIPDEATEEGGGERLLLVRDRTELKALEEDLSEAKRLAAIGRLAAGLAHEIRNPLSALRGFAQFFQKKLKGREPEEQYADTMVREADRLDKVITDLLFLSRPREPELCHVDLAALGRSLENLLRFDLEHADADFSMDIREPRVMADADMLKQALLNLVLNSLAAVERVDEPGRIVLSSEAEGGMLALSVADNGPGMLPEEREHALEPFFTSKKQGTGLGLAIVHRIARDHGGHVEIRTQCDGPERGTQVRLLLPLRKAAKHDNQGSGS